MAKPVCVISGVGPGTGTALVRRFAAGDYRIAMLARTADRLAELAGQVPSAKAYVCDVSDQSQVDAAVDLVERELIAGHNDGPLTGGYHGRCDTTREVEQAHRVDLEVPIERRWVDLHERSPGAAHSIVDQDSGSAQFALH